jgi:hypothetical protein
MKGVALHDSSRRQASHADHRRPARALAAPTRVERGSFFARTRRPTQGALDRATLRLIPESR